MSPEQVAWIKLATAAFASGILAWDALARRGGRAPGASRRRDAALLAAGLLGAAGWWNYFEFRYEPGFGHPHDVFHYYMGSKYFDELRYTRLYECTTVADAQSGFAAEAAARTIRNLETYRREGTAEILAHPERCTSHFSPERWETFVHDVGFFRERFPAGSWRGLLADHGYNPSPAWGAVATLFVGRAPVSDARLAPLLLLDPLLLAAMWFLVWRAFGWRPLCVAWVFWGTNAATDYLWTGGAFLRQGWLAALGIGLACLRLGRAASAGFTLMVAALLRVFPGVSIAAIALAAAIEAARTRSLRPRRELLRFAAGCTAAATILIALAFATAGGPSAWAEFAHNIRFHEAVDFGTDVGLERFLAYAFDPTGIAHGALWLTIALGYALLLARAVARCEIWEAAILGCGAVLILTTMANYYLGVLIGFGLLWERARWIGVGLCVLSVFTGCVARLAPTAVAAHAWISFGAAVFVLAATAAIGLRRRGAAVAPG